MRYLNPSGAKQAHLWEASGKLIKIGAFTSGFGSVSLARTGLVLTDTSTNDPMAAGAALPVMP